MQTNKNELGFEREWESDNQLSQRTAILHTSSLHISLQDIPKDITLGELIDSKGNFNATISFQRLIQNQPNSENDNYAEKLVREVEKW